MRLFVAINFSNDTKNKLLDLRDELQSRSKRGNFTLPENLHLTLAFLGECDAKQAAAIKTAMDAVAFEPFDLTIDRLGRFKRDGGDIWWVSVKESKPLADLQYELTDKLIDDGFSLEKRKYSPHITLGREVMTDAAPQQIEPIEERISSIELMKSERIQGKLTYTAIHKKRGMSGTK
jgi:2'-5' RNA ligase